MANKRPAKKKSTGNSLKREKESGFSMKATLRDERTHKIFGFFLILLGILMLVAMASYCLTWRQDFDKVASSPDFFSNKDIKVNNLLGRLGAWIA